MQKIRSSETSVNLYQIAYRHLTGDSHRYENFKPSGIHLLEVLDFLWVCLRKAMQPCFSGMGN
jgi:hypothetical protein